MSLYMGLLPTFLLVFGSSFLFNIFADYMVHHADSGPDIQPVEVVNLSDLGGRR